MARDVRLIRSPISVAGMVLTTISAVLFLSGVLLPLTCSACTPTPTSEIIVFFLVLPDHLHASACC